MITTIFIRNIGNKFWLKIVLIIIYFCVITFIVYLILYKKKHELKLAK